MSDEKLEAAVAALREGDRNCAMQPIVDWLIDKDSERLGSLLLTQFAENLINTLTDRGEYKRVRRITDWCLGCEREMRESV